MLDEKEFRLPENTMNLDSNYRSERQGEEGGEGGTMSPG